MKAQIEILTSNQIDISYANGSANMIFPHGFCHVALTIIVDYLCGFSSYVCVLSFILLFNETEQMLWANSDAKIIKYLQPDSLYIPIFICTLNSHKSYIYMHLSA